MTLGVPRRFGVAVGRPIERTSLQEGRTNYDIEDECVKGFHVWEPRSNEESLCNCGRKMLRTTASRNVFIKKSNKTGGRES